jgi:hypothetical protein
MSTFPRVVCVCCRVTEVAWYELTCDGCRPTLEAAGLIEPGASDTSADQRIQIAPTDI